MRTPPQPIKNEYECQVFDRSGQPLPCFAGDDGRKASVITVWIPSEAGPPGSIKILRKTYGNFWSVLQLSAGGNRELVASCILEEKGSIGELRLPIPNDYVENGMLMKHLDLRIEVTRVRSITQRDARLASVQAGVPVVPIHGGETSFQSLLLNSAANDGRIHCWCHSPYRKEDFKPRNIFMFKFRSEAVIRDAGYVTPSAAELPVHIPSLDVACIPVPTFDQAEVVSDAKDLLSGSIVPAAMTMLPSSPAKTPSPVPVPVMTSKEQPLVASAFVKIETEVESKSFPVANISQGIADLAQRERAARSRQLQAERERNAAERELLDIEIEREDLKFEIERRQVPVSSSESPSTGNGSKANPIVYKEN